MPFTRIYTGISLQTVDTFIPEEQFLTLNEALIAYGLSANETQSITDGLYHEIDNSPTSGSCLLTINSTEVSGIWLCSKNTLGSNVSKISSVNSGSVYLDAQWDNEKLKFRANNNSATISFTISIKT